MLVFDSYLAVVAGLCVEADYIFIPESPPKPDWPDRLCQQLEQASTPPIIHRPCPKIKHKECARAGSGLQLTWDWIHYTPIQSLCSQSRVTLG